MKKIFLHLILTLLSAGVVTVLSSSPLQAASPTPSPSATPAATKKPTTTKAAAQTPTPSPTPTTEEETTQKLKERIDRVLDEKESQVQGTTDDSGMKKRGFIGEVQRVTEKTVTIKNKKGTHILTVTDDVVILKENKKATIDDIAVGDWVIAMGYRKENAEEFELKRLIISSAPLRPELPQVYLGTMNAVTKTQVTLTPRSTKEKVNFLTNKDTKYIDGRGATMDRSALQVDVQYLIFSTQNNQDKVAKIIRALAAPEK